MVSLIGTVCQSRIAPASPTWRCPNDCQEVSPHRLVRQSPGRVETQKDCERPKAQVVDPQEAGHVREAFQFFGLRGWSRGRMAASPAACRPFTGRWTGWGSRAKKAQRAAEQD